LELEAMTEGKRGGRVAGQRNRRTAALMELAEEGESPVSHCLRVMRDDTQPPDLRLQAARICAPFVHPKPVPERFVTFELPEQPSDGSADLLAIHAAILRAVAAGSVSLEEALQLSAIVQSHARIVETTDLEARIAALEQEKRQ
jgi:hypothetical protein